MLTNNVNCRRLTRYLLPVTAASGSADVSATASASGAKECEVLGNCVLCKKPAKLSEGVTPTSKYKKADGTVVVYYRHKVCYEVCALFDTMKIKVQLTPEEQLYVAATPVSEKVAWYKDHGGHVDTLARHLQMKIVEKKISHREITAGQSSLPFTEQELYDLGNYKE